MKTTIYFTAVLFLLILSSCSDYKGEKGLNNEASLPETLTNKVSGLKVINSSINNKKHTTSLLYGNQKAVERIKSNGLLMQKGEKLIWITWNQKPDPNWLGAYIPGKLLSFEIIESKDTVEYKKYSGNGMQVKMNDLDTENRIKNLLAEKMAIMP